MGSAGLGILLIAVLIAKEIRVLLDSSAQDYAWEAAAVFLAAVLLFMLITRAPFRDGAGAGNSCFGPTEVSGLTSGRVCAERRPLDLGERCERPVVTAAGWRARDATLHLIGRKSV
jgi:hypothetical protein